MGRAPKEWVEAASGEEGGDFADLILSGTEIRIFRVLGLKAIEFGYCIISRGTTLRPRHRYKEGPLDRGVGRV
jgi:hypothetical protein